MTSSSPEGRQEAAVLDAKALEAAFEEANSRATVTRSTRQTVEASIRAYLSALIPAKPAVEVVEAQLIRWAHDTLYEINPDNYDRAEVCKLNDASVEVILGLAQYLGERHGKTEEWWRDYTAKHPIAALQAPTPDAHPDDLAVDRFAAAMKAKLAKKREEGRGGWDGPSCSANILSDLLRSHVDKGDPVDVANLAMMLHQRGERII